MLGEGRPYCNERWNHVLPLHEISSRGKDRYYPIIQRAVDNFTSFTLPPSPSLSLSAFLPARIKEKGENDKEEEEEKVKKRKKDRSEYIDVKRELRERKRREIYTDIFFDRLKIHRDDPPRPSIHPCSTLARVPSS